MGVALIGGAAAAADPFTGTVTFEPEPPPPASTYTVAQKDAWMAKLRSWVEGGGNLVLTDGALRAVSELTSVPGSAIARPPNGDCAGAVGVRADEMFDGADAPAALVARTR